MHSNYTLVKNEIEKMFNQICKFLFKFYFGRTNLYAVDEHCNSALKINQNKMIYNTFTILPYKSIGKAHVSH